MGVTTKTTVGVGFLVDPDGPLPFDPEEVENAGLYDLLYAFLNGDYPFLTLTTGGSGMDGTEKYVVSVLRLEREFDAYYDAGVVGFDKPTLTLEERVELYKAGTKLLGHEPNISQFVAIYVG